ncbi:MAG TPA: diacylglycerol kinase [Steroidobacteraceae bacterium]|nr:diacylglycerol kinase [Steroidobacteraceae bacterium]
MPARLPQQPVRRAGGVRRDPAAVRVRPRRLAATGDHKNQSFPARLKFALQGLAHGVRAEASLRVQAVSLAAAVVALLLLRPAAVWWALVLLAAAVVLSAELLNTALEQLADELHPQDSPGVRRAKDCAAAAVLIASLGALAVAVALAVHLLRR